MVLRTFRNADPPALANLWQSQSPSPFLSQPISASTLDRMVFSKPFFDRRGVIVAESDGKVSGFAHAGFGPEAGGHRLSYRIGSTSMLMVRSSSETGLAETLLGRSEQYLREKGAEKLRGGNIEPVDPFYYGIYGAGAPGIRESDAARLNLFRTAGYQPVKRYRIFQRALVTFRPVVDRIQLQVKRQFDTTMVYDQPVATWWEACTLGQLDRLRFTVFRRDSGPPKGAITLADLNLVTGCMTPRQFAILNAEFDEVAYQEGLALFLTGEALRQLQSYGVYTIEAHAAEDDPKWLAILVQLGFTETDRSNVYEKSA